jgi:hypothetical protein
LSGTLVTISSAVCTVTGLWFCSLRFDSFSRDSFSPSARSFVRSFVGVLIALSGSTSLPLKSHDSHVRTHSQFSIQHFITAAVYGRCQRQRFSKRRRTLGGMRSFLSSHPASPATCRLSVAVVPPLGLRQLPCGAGRRSARAGGRAESTAPGEQGGASVRPSIVP